MYVTGRFIGLLYIDVVLMVNVIFLLTNEEHWFVSTLINSTALSSEIHSVKCIQMKIKLLSNMHFPNHFFLKPTTSTKDLSNLRENLATCVQYLRIFIQRFKQPLPVSLRFKSRQLHFYHVFSFTFFLNFFTLIGYYIQPFYTDIPISATSGQTCCNSNANKLQI